MVVSPGMLTWALGFDPLAGLRLASDEDLRFVAGNIVRQTPLPVVDFADWWDRSPAIRPAAVHR